MSEEQTTQIKQELSSNGEDSDIEFVEENAPDASNLRKIRNALMTVDANANLKVESDECYPHSPTPARGLFISWQKRHYNYSTLCVKYGGLISWVPCACAYQIVAPITNIQIQRLCDCIYIIHGCNIYSYLYFIFYLFIIIIFIKFLCYEKNDFRQNQKQRTIKTCISVRRFPKGC